MERRRVGRAGGGAAAAPPPPPAPPAEPAFKRGWDAFERKDEDELPQYEIDPWTGLPVGGADPSSGAVARQPGDQRHWTGDEEKIEALNRPRVADTSENQNRPPRTASGVSEPVTRAACSRATRTPR